MFRRLHQEGQTILLVTHSEDVASGADRIVWMRDGRIEHTTQNDTAAASAMAGR